MQCKSDGCYAKVFRKNLCRNHFYMWIDAIPATAPRQSERSSSEQPRRQQPKGRYGVPVYLGPCRCESPRPYKIPWFGCYECLNCGMPLPTERIADASTQATVA